MGLGAELPTATPSLLSACPVPEPLLPWEIVARNASWLITANYPLANYRFLPLVTLISWLLSTQKFVSLLQKLVLPKPQVLCCTYISLSVFFIQNQKGLTSYSPSGWPSGGTGGLPLFSFQ